MTMLVTSEFERLKRALRARARHLRGAQPDKQELSRRIWEALVSLPAYSAAQTVMVYVNLPDEVPTQPYLPVLQQQGKQVVVPYCVDGELALFSLEGLGELAPGTLGILEPKPGLRAQPARLADVSRLDLLIVPGVAFDRRGGRLGQGKGYFDRLLRRVPSHAFVVGVAFECQLLPDVPMLSHDVYMDAVITEQAVYRGKGHGIRSP